jgi:hypothetical protein
MFNNRSKTPAADATSTLLNFLKQEQAVAIVSSSGPTAGSKATPDGAAG